MLEYICNENERDSAHLVGKASDEVKGEVKLSSQVLARYAGSYQSGPVKAVITIAGEQLMFSLGGKGAVPLATLSETSFYFPGGFPVEFVRDDKGTVTHFLFYAPGSELKFVRAGAANP